MKTKIFPDALIEKLAEFLGRQGAALETLRGELAKEIDRSGLLPPEKLWETIHDQFDADEDARTVSLAIVRLSSSLDREETTVEEAVASATAHTPKDANAKAYKKSLRELVELANQPDVLRAVKMGRLAYDHPSALQDGSIIVDLRPVFDNGREESIGYIVLANLQFLASDKYGTRTRSFVLDYEEILKLKTSCELALKKIDALKDAVQKKLGSPIYVPGLHDDDNDESGREK